MTKFAMTHESLSQEMTNGQNKASRKSNRAPFRILADLSDNFTPEDIALWETWETESRGRRMMTWSVGMRELANLSRELTDEEVVMLDQLNGTMILSIPSKDWASLMRRGLAAELLSTLETYGPCTTIDMLAYYGIVSTIHVNPLTFTLEQDTELQHDKA